jgi:flavin reductase (DIM6/NTAB) family NADH-FMN oxidoreductase RutF
MSVDDDGTSTGATTNAFDCIVEHLDYPMFVVGAASDGEVDACLVGFTTQCSIDPPRFAVFLSKNNRTYELASAADVLVVHRLRADQHDVAEHFGAISEKDDPGKLDEWPWRPGPGGAPVIDGCDWFAGRVEGRFDGGDHVAFVLAPVPDSDGGECADLDQLGAHEARGIDAGQPAGEPD